MRIRMQYSTAATLMIVIGCIIFLGGIFLLTQSVVMGLGFFALGAGFVYLGVKARQKLK